MKRFALLLLGAALVACAPPPAEQATAWSAPPDLESDVLARLDTSVANALTDAHASWRQAHEASADINEQVAGAVHFGKLALAYEQYAWAAEALAWARDRQPDDYRWHYLLAVAQLNRDEIDAGMASLNAALRLQPDHVPARLQLAERLIERGELAEAGRALGRARDSDSAAMLGMRGRLAQAQGDHGGAVELLQRALQLEPEASRLRYPLGLALRAAGRESAARAEIAQRGQGSPHVDDPLLAEVAALADSAEVLSTRAAALAANGDFHHAVEVYRQALAAREDNLTRLNLAISLARSDRTAEAEAEYRRVLQADPDLGAAHFGLGVLLAAQGRDADATEHYERALQLHPGDLDARFNLANALRRQGQRSAALSHFSEVVRRDPARADARLAQAQLLIEMRDWLEARNVLTSALEAHPGDARIALHMARLLAGAGEAEVRDGAAALRLAEQLFHRERSLPHGEALAMALAETGRFEEARQLQAELVASVRQQGRDDLLADLEWALDNYRAGRPQRLH